MSRFWGLTEKGEYWASFFPIPRSKERREPVLWTCRSVPFQEQLLREQVQIYDPFVGLALPQKVATCLGVLNTRGYLTTDGLTFELLPLEAIPNPIPLTDLVAAEAFPSQTMKQLSDCGMFQPLEISHWNSLKNVITETNPLLTSSLATVENWHQRRDYLERILEIVAQRGCSEEHEQELFTVLRTLTRCESERQESSDQLTLQTQLRLALKAQLLPAKEWEQLCKKIMDTWYGYVMTLTPQEINRLTDLDRNIQL